MRQPEPYILMNELKGGYRALCTAILIQAILDYQELCDKGVASIGTYDRGRYSKNEITRFFHSEWCTWLLEYIGGNYDGISIIEALKKNEATKPRGTGRKVAAFTESHEFVKSFDSLVKAAEFAGLGDTAGISRCCRGARLTAGGYVWKYI